ncbi:MAG: hypothetical protein IKI06_02800 [Prevotella sp.]|nr:hypothetical protein [Prevotella sp.]
MKKYLITGALALVACATLTSCHSDDELSGSLIEQKLKAYEQVFEEEFGKVNPNQDWGFGTAKVSTRTRATGEFADYVGAYPDANMWTSKGFLAPPPLTRSQHLRAQYYFQMNHITEPNRPDYGQIDFFMQQVYDGGDDPMPGKSLEKYPSADYTPESNNYITSGEHMDHLTCGPDHTHTYNFNNGNCSTNPNVADRDQTDVNNTDQQHADEIQLMLNTKTSCFGYANSDASYVRDDRWTLVSAADIDYFCDHDAGFQDWLKERLGNEEDVKCDDEYHRDYIGFDFDMLPDETVFAGVEQWKNGDASNGWQRIYLGKNYATTDYYRYELYGPTYHYLSANGNQYCGESQTIDPEPDQERALQLISQGWLPASGSADKRWIKVGGCNDGYFSDWIVTFMPSDAGRLPETITIPIEPGTTSGYTQRTYRQLRYRTDLIQNGRILCEDLGTSSISDIDFNDIVFDAWMYHIVPEVRTKVVKLENNSETVLQDWSEWDDSDPDYADLGYYTTDVYLLAGGGTIPATVGGVSFKNALGTDTPFLVNTVDDRDKSNIKRYGNPYDNTIGWHQPKDLKDMRNIESLNDIEVVVLYNNAPVPLTSEVGEVPHKICVPIGTKWPYERIVVNEAYDFNDYVKNGSSISYEGENAIPILNSNDEVVGYYLDERERTDEDGNNIWTKNPTEAQKDSRYHGDITEDTDITGVPYKDSARVIEGEGRYTTPEDLQYEEEAVSGEITGGYQNDDPVLIRRRH